MKVVKDTNSELCNVQHDKYNYHCCMLYMNVIKSVNPKSSHHNEKIFFTVSLILYQYEMMDFC